jgi:hypothetical protein
MSDCLKTVSGEEYRRVCRELAEEIGRLRSALSAIRQLGLGPDQGTSAWQAQTAHEIATEALTEKPNQTPS